VLDKLTIKHITPPLTAHGPSDQEWTAKTPYITAKVQKQMHLIKQLINRNSESPLNEAIRQLAKSAEYTMHKVLLLDQEVKELRAANEV
jgi:hypothetical protein